jgi:lipoyl(octanoyl) transferase
MSSVLRYLGCVDLVSTVAAMRTFTETRTINTADEIWICEHPPVYTQGLAGKASHVLDAGDVPVIQTNRGGQVTYHGPGQVVAYPLIDLKRLGIYVKEYVYRLEHCVLKTLEHVGVTGHRVPGAPGIYVRVQSPFDHAPLEVAAPKDRLGVKADDPFCGLGKIAALGIKVSQQRSYHGLALNVAMDLRPFERINPCGYEGLKTVDLATLGVCVSWAEAAHLLGDKLALHLSP